MHILPPTIITINDVKAPTSSYEVLIAWHMLIALGVATVLIGCWLAWLCWAVFL